MTTTKAYESVEEPEEEEPERHVTVRVTIKPQANGRFCYIDSHLFQDICPFFDQRYAYDGCGCRLGFSPKHTVITTRDNTVDAYERPDKCKACETP